MLIRSIDKIFTKFYNNKNQHRYETNGIGLSLTKELVNRHYGEIGVKSDIGNGSIFTVKIPIDKDIYDVSEIAEVSEISVVEKIQEEETIIQKDNKSCILFIDDNDELRDVVHHMLSSEYNILTSEDGKNGLEIVKNNPVDIIICDIMMPHMNGFEFCQNIKNDLHINHIPIIILTAKNSADDQIDCYKAGAESYITKPFEIKTLKARIENLLDKRKVNQDNFRERTELNLSNLYYRNSNDKFLNNAILCVEKHIKNPDLDLDLMASELNISRSTLTRKCKVIDRKSVV